MDDAHPTSEPQLTHLDTEGRVRMVDVGDKAVTTRTATAEGIFRTRPDVVRRVAGDALGGQRLRDVLAVGEHEDAQRHGDELDHESARHGAAGGEGVDGPRDELRHDQVEAVGGDGEADDRRDGAAIRPEEREQAWPGGARRSPGAGGSACTSGSARRTGLASR